MRRTDTNLQHRRCSGVCMKLVLSLCLLAIVSLPQAGIAAGADNLMQDVFVLDPIEVTGRMQEDNLD